jgi:hypothetical protein
MYVQVKDLPAPVVVALKSVDYGRADIEVRPATSVVLSDSGTTGRKAFAVLVSLTTGQHQTIWGSWGGPNMFVANPVDSDTRSYPLPSDGVALTGSIGPHGTFATLHIPATMVDRMLPSAGPELTTEERDALYCHKAIKGGAYRRDELSRRKVSAATVDAMVDRGFLKRNKAAATSITTDGKNALGDYRGYGA